MNTANYTQQDTYPVTTEGLAFIQNQSLVLEQMAAMLGTGNWILSGMDEDSDGNLTPGIVAIVADNSAKVMNYGGGDPAEGLSTAHFSISETTPASPFYRTSQNLILDPDGDITALDRPDIAELAQQIKDNAAAIATKASNSSVTALRSDMSNLDAKVTNLSAKKVKSERWTRQLLTHGEMESKLRGLVSKSFSITGHINFTPAGSEVVQDFDAIDYDYATNSYLIKKWSPTDGWSTLYTIPQNFGSEYKIDLVAYYFE